MGRQIVDWFAALLMLRLMVAVLCILLLQRVLAWVQRTLEAFEPHELPAPRAAAGRRYRRQQSGVRRARRQGTACARAPFDYGND
jgi:hypothetical protein